MRRKYYHRLPQIEGNDPKKKLLSTVRKPMDYSFRFRNEVDNLLFDQIIN
jgi:hypothetical protein